MVDVDLEALTKKTVETIETDLDETLSSRRNRWFWWLGSNHVSSLESSPDQALQVKSQIKTWKELEEKTFEIFKSLCEPYQRYLECKVVRQAELKGITSGATYKVDVKVSFDFGTSTHTIIIECKYWNKKLKRDQVSKMIGILQDTGAEKGIIVSRKGFYKSAISLAAKNRIDLLTFEQLCNVAYEYIDKIKCEWCTSELSELKDKERFIMCAMIVPSFILDRVMWISDRFIIWENILNEIRRHRLFPEFFKILSKEESKLDYIFREMIQIDKVFDKIKAKIMLYMPVWGPEILDFLHLKPQSNVEEIAEELGRHPADMLDVLKDLVTKGLVCYSARGYYLCQNAQINRQRFWGPMGYQLKNGKRFYGPMRHYFKNGKRVTK